MDTSTPSSVMYGALKSLHVSNVAAAPLLLDDSTHHGGSETPAERAKRDKYWLSRTIVGAQPGDLSENYFSDLAHAAQSLTSYIASRGPKMGYDDIVAALCNEPLAAMSDALTRHGIDPSPFCRAMSKAQADGELSDADRASLVMLIFIATGCLADPLRAAQLAQDFGAMTAAAGNTFKTDIAVECTPQAPCGAPAQLGLIRVIDGALDLHRLSPLAPEGTVIGSMPTGKNVISNVGELVSRQHVRVWQDETGRWMVQGMGSTNGTVLLRGGDRQEVIVEPPKKERGRTTPCPVPLEVGDTLVLAGTTVFIAVNTCLGS